MRIIAAISSVVSPSRYRSNVLVDVGYGKIVRLKEYFVTYYQ